MLFRSDNSFSGQIVYRSLLYLSQPLPALDIVQAEAETNIVTIDTRSVPKKNYLEIAVNDVEGPS